MQLQTNAFNSNVINNYTYAFTCIHQSAQPIPHDFPESHLSHEQARCAFLAQAGCKMCSGWQP